MPEGNVVLQNVDRITKALVRDGQWPYFRNITCQTGRFNVDLSPFEKVKDQRMLDFFCKGKTFFTTFPNEVSITSHVGMQGDWSFEPDGKNAHFEIQLTFTLDPTEEPMKLYYNNQRFGSFEVLKTKAELDQAIDKLAPGFIGRYIISIEEWLRRMAGFTKRKSLMRLMMDQTELCSGIGNFLIAELFWYARLHPQVTLGRLTQDDRIMLYHVCLKVITGHYEKTLPKVIYMKEISPEGHKIIQQKFTDRTTHWVPEVQTIL